MTEIATILRTIAESSRRRVARARTTHRRPAAPTVKGENRFLAALAARRGRAIIAEVKMGSPRLGSLAGRVDPETQASLYADVGAAALSVVVEPEHFFGGYDLLSRCASASGLPAIAKDFVLDPIQIEWAYSAGASAVLLIAALLSADELRALAAHARLYGLVSLVETHDPADIAKLEGPDGQVGQVGQDGHSEQASCWELVGINNRDLRTFEVDLEHSLRLVERLPRGALRVAESGIRSSADLGILRAGGFDAFLIGESLLLADDPAAKLRELVESA
jgi:indole-3-glycerol phosphate synthase